MSIKDLYHVKSISYREAMDIVVQYHYLHRRAPASFMFGLFDKDEIIRGVVVYGTPPSSTLRAGICGIEQKDNVIELTRLWVNDDVLERNAASYLIGQTIKLIDKEIVVSYADASVGHVGYVYQATNWIYTGLSAKRKNWQVRGYEHLHSQSISDRFGKSDDLRREYGDDFYSVERPRKHRYVYFNTKSAKRKKELLALLRYPIVKEYPKLIRDFKESAVKEPV